VILAILALSAPLPKSCLRSLRNCGRQWKKTRRGTGIDGCVLGGVLGGDGEVVGKVETDRMLDVERCGGGDATKALLSTAGECFARPGRFLLHLRSHHLPWQVTFEQLNSAVACFTLTLCDELHLCHVPVSCVLFISRPMCFRALASLRLSAPVSEVVLCTRCWVHDQTDYVWVLFGQFVVVAP